MNEPMSEKAVRRRRLKLIALRGLAEQADNPAPDEAVLDAMDALL